MKTWLVVGLVATAVGLLAFQAMPRCTSLEPDTGKKGDTISAKGENLDKKSIAEMYLVDGSKDIPVKMSAQTETEQTAREWVVRRSTPCSLLLKAFDSRSRSSSFVAGIDFEARSPQRSFGS